MNISLWKELCFLYTDTLEDIAFQKIWQYHIFQASNEEDNTCSGWEKLLDKESKKLKKLEVKLNRIKKYIRKESELALCELLNLPIVTTNIIVSYLHIYDLFDIFQLYEKKTVSSKQ